MKILKKNEIYDVLIESYSSEGHGVCRLEGRAVFVPKTICGERWRVRIVKVASAAVYARPEELLSSSEHRCEPDCAHFSVCGGCSLWHMDYEEELRFKLRKVNDALRHIGKQSLTADEIHAAPSLDSYRNKAIYAVSSIEGKARYGFFRERSHQLVPVERCLIQHELSDRVAAAVTAFMNENGIAPYDETAHSGVVRHVFCRRAVNTADAVACVVVFKGLGSKTAALVDALTSACPELTGIVLNVNRNEGNTVLSGDFYTLWGKAEISDTLCGHSFEISPQAFFQINPPQAEKLYSIARQYALPQAGGLVFELYCGAGTISLCLAERADKLIGAEIVPQAVENAKENAAKNGISNVEFICADAGEAAQNLAQRGLKPDAVVVDPPRKGMSEQAIEAVAQMCPRRIVYVSCNPATLARDILRFNSCGYELAKACAVDMFPRTPHVESIVCLSKLADTHIELEIDPEELDTITAKVSPTYPEIKAYVMEHHGMKVSSLAIAQAKKKCGLEVGECYNLPSGHGRPPTNLTPEKEAAIRDAFQYYGLI